MEKRDMTFRQLIREFQELDRQLSDTNMYGDEGVPMVDEMGRFEGHEDEGYVGHHDQQDGGDSAEEQAMHASEVIKHEPIIGKIRETAIEGLRKYADNPTSEIYAYFKSVFLDSDKLLTGKK